MPRDYLKAAGIRNEEARAEFVTIANDWWEKELAELAEIMQQKPPIPPPDASYKDIVLANKAITFIEGSKKAKIDHILKLAKFKDGVDTERTPEQMRADIIKEAQAAIVKQRAAKEEDGDTD